MAKSVDQLIIEMTLENKKVLKSLTQFQKDLKNTTKTTTKETSKMGKDWLKLGLKIAGFGYAIKKAFDLGKEFAQYKQGFDALNKATNGNADNILKRLKEVSAGTIANKDLVLASNRAVALNVTKDVDKMSKLLIVARERAKAMGISTTQAFDDMVTGIGRNSPLILDNLGIITKGWSEQAKSQGVAMDSAFIMNKILEDNADAIKNAGEESMTGAERIAKLGAVWDNLKIAIGQFMQSDAVKGFIDFATEIIGGVTSAVESWSKFGRLISTSEQEFLKTGKIMNATREEGDAWRKHLIMVAEAIEKKKISHQRMMKAVEDEGRSIFKTTKAEKDLAISTEILAELQEKFADAIEKTGMSSFKTAEDFLKAYRLIQEEAIKTSDLINLPDKENKTDENIEKRKGSIISYYQFVKDLKTADLLTEKENYAEELENLKILLANKEISNAEFLDKKAKLEFHHINNMNEIQRQHYGTMVEDQNVWLEKSLENIMGFEAGLIGVINNTFEQYAEGISDSIASGEIWKKSFSSFMADMIRQVAKLILKLTVVAGLQAVLGVATGGLTSFIPGFAEGTKSAPGGLAVVGERGPELAVLPKGTEVIPNHRIGNLSRFASLPHFANGTPGGNISDIANNEQNINIAKIEITANNKQEMIDSLKEIGDQLGKDLFS